MTHTNDCLPYSDTLDIPLHTLTTIHNISKVSLMARFSRVHKILDSFSTYLVTLLDNRLPLYPAGVTDVPHSDDIGFLLAPRRLAFCDLACWTRHLLEAPRIFPIVFSQESDTRIVVRRRNSTPS
jgi:hypothetical protein